MRATRRAFTELCRAGAGCLLAFLVLLSAGTARAQSDSREPYFLVATRGLPDPNFARSVVLILPRKVVWAVVGVIINRPTDKPVQQLFAHAPAFKKPADTAFFGGPVDVDQPSLILHENVPGPDALPILDDLYFSMYPPTVLNEVASAKPDAQIRVYLGRSQWSSEQLRDETEEGSWYVEPADPAMIFSADPARLWSTLVNRGILAQQTAHPTEAALWR